MFPSQVSDTTCTKSSPRLRAIVNRFPPLASWLTSYSYNLFSTNVIFASISFVYWPDGGKWHSLVINLCTLVGSVIGQFLFGFLADYYGRTRLYGIELILVIVSTIGVATSSYGYQDLSFLALFSWVCRCFCALTCSMRLTSSSYVSGGLSWELVSRSGPYSTGTISPSLVANMRQVSEASTRSAQS